MLGETIKAIRKSKGLSQEELAALLNVVRQTVSKWEQGRSVPDADLLIALSEALQVPVSTLLGETAYEETAEPLSAISEKLACINFQLARQAAVRRRVFHWFFIALCVGIAAVFAALFIINGSYLNWDLTSHETAVASAALHAFEWLFVRLAPIVFVGGAVGICLTRKRA